MSNLTDAAALRIGATNVRKVYLGGNRLWPAATVPVVIKGQPVSGTAGSGLSATITLPSYTSGDYLLLVVSRNQADALPWMGDAHATVTEIATASRRLSLLLVQPVGTPGSFVLTANVASLWSWTCLNLGHISPDVQTAVREVGNSATAAIEFDPIAATTVTDGNQLVLVIAGTNSSAVWTAPAGTAVDSAAAGAPGLLVASFVPAAGLETITIPVASRGNNGTNRLENSISVLLRA